MSDSSTGGLLTPSGATAPPMDTALEDLLQAIVVGLTALPAAMVRPRWQVVTPKQPEPAVDWCALGFIGSAPDTGPAIIHSGTGDGSDTLQRHRTMRFLASFYGPNGHANAEQFVDGLSLPQTNEAFRTYRMAIVSAGEVVAAADLINQNWVRRFDMTFELRRQVVRTYEVFNLLDAPFALRADSMKQQSSDQQINTDIPGSTNTPATD
ncbi:phage neck terminator protein [Robbsia andropogonis]|uniref:phage neck terminator protein n=1 Tax=Robbsia andropogonis TaxID=28092 RepID=UPI003D260CFA